METAYQMGERGSFTTSRDAAAEHCWETHRLRLYTHLISLSLSL